jgi:hypothetical protein
MKNAVTFICAYIVFTGCNRIPVIDIPAEAEAIKKSKNSGLLR